jgi:glycosyltransferase involved in cell wall biosynthesis
MKILIATDAWWPQINGVVQTLASTISELERRGHATHVISPQDFRNAPMPGYREIRLAWPGMTKIRSTLKEFQPDHVHIATEGPIGWAMRRICMKQRRRFTTCYHTRFPEYLRERLPVPVKATYRVFRRFHNASNGMMVATETIERDLKARGFQNLMRWSRGSDISAFKPGLPPVLDLPRPIFLSVGRLAPEKNIEAFLSLDLPGTKVVVGDGPLGPSLRAQFPQAVFLGVKTHAELPAIYGSADVFVFPSLTDTFGLVLVEALACGLPVAALPAPGPIDVIGSSGAGIISDDLQGAALAALQIDRGICRRHAETFTWERATDQFLANIVRAETAEADPVLLAAE